MLYYTNLFLRVANYQTPLNQNYQILHLPHNQILKIYYKHKFTKHIISQ